MSEIYLYLLLLVIALIWVNGSLLGFTQRDNKILADNNVSVIEHLAKFSVKPKNYRNPPEQYNSYGYAIQARVEGEGANLIYHFPLLQNVEAKYFVSFESNEFSTKVSGFGVHNSCFGPADAKSYKLTTTDFQFLQRHMNKDGFYFNNISDYGIDYNYLIQMSHDVGVHIATFISNQLQEKGCDNYINRIQAALNFVQFLPYGLPEFDEGDYGYFGFSLPHESMAISYADCDSKSALFTCILKQLIRHQNIILVLCQFKSGEEGMHMITGVSNLPFDGQTVTYKEKQYLLLETTVPMAIYEQQHKYTIHKIIPIN
jgi:hypothetical protein